MGRDRKERSDEHGDRQQQRSEREDGSGRAPDGGRARSERQGGACRGAALLARGMGACADRRDPVAVLEEQALTRVPELIPIRYGRMLVSPFTFYRGGAALMAADLADAPRTGLDVQLCGDAHLSNFGSFAAPDRRLDLRPQRLRRDAARPVRVGRQAPRRELRGRRPRPRVRRQAARADQSGRGALVPRGDAGVRPDAGARPLVRAPRHRRDRGANGRAGATRSR